MPLLSRLRGDAMQAGISPTIPNDEGFPWHLSMNAVFAERSIQPALGQTLLSIGQGKRVSDLLTNRVNKVPTLFIGAADCLYAWNENAGEVPLGDGYDGSGNWWLESWGNHVVASNGIDPIQYWSGGGFNPLVGAPATAEILVHRNPYMVAFNTSAGGNHVSWCSDDDINDWVTATNNTAGDLFIRDMDSDIIAALPLGDEILFYGSDSIHSLSYRGSPYIFGSNKLAEAVGPVGKHAICEVGRSHFGFSTKGIFRTTGYDYQFVDKDLVHDWIYGNISNDPEMLSRVVAYNDEVEELVFFFFPSEGAVCNDRCIAYSYRYNNWQPMSLRREAAVNVSAFQFGITADAFGNIYLQQTKELLTNQNVVPMGLWGFGASQSGYGTLPYGVDQYGGQGARPSWCFDQPRGIAKVTIDDPIQGERNPQTLPAPGELIWAETKDLDFGNPLSVKNIERLQIHVEPTHHGLALPSGIINYYIAAKNDRCEPDDFQGPFDALDCNKEELNFEGVWFKVRIEASIPEVRWKLSSIDFIGDVVAEEYIPCPEESTTDSQSQILSSTAGENSQTGSDTGIVNISLKELNWSGKANSRQQRKTGL